MNGILNVNKPPGMTSHDVVDRLRRLLQMKKVGHTGTLDPDATGVLPIALGRATKIIQFLQDEEKEYEGTITLGIVTDTLDGSGKVLRISDSEHIRKADIKSVLSQFSGEMDQIPPMVSAIKIDGKRLYKAARQGKIVKRTPRRIYIYSLDLLFIYQASCLINADQCVIKEPSRQFTRIDFRVRCSRGTYVRALAADIGDALGCGGHLSRLVRTRSGIFDLKDSIRLEEIQADPQNALCALRSIDDVLCFIPIVVINYLARERFLNGVSVRNSDLVHYEGQFQVNDLLRVHDETGTLLGIGRATESTDSPTASNPQTMICKVVKVLEKIQD